MENTPVPRLLLIGHGRMGRLVEILAGEHGCEIAAVVSRQSGRDSIAGDYGHVDVAIDFSLPDAVYDNVVACARRQLNVVIGTTGWQTREDALKLVADNGGIGVLASANFALGMHVFRRVVGEAARHFAAMENVAAWVHEKHHAAKKDAPSGTALTLKRAMETAGYGRAIDVSSTRAGSIPGTHEIGFDASAETVTLTHTVRDRAVFAHGALEAAKWLRGRRGWFTIDDML